MEKHSESRLSYLFAHLHLLSSDLVSSDSSHLCFSTVHIVGSFTSKLPSIIYYPSKKRICAKIFTIKEYQRGQWFGNLGVCTTTMFSVGSIPAFKLHSQVATARCMRHLSRSRAFTQWNKSAMENATLAPFCSQ